MLGTSHLSVADYWSIGLISDELGALYDAYARGEEPRLPALSIQYGDFAIWQREESQGVVMQRELAYWMGQLQNLPQLQFPTDRPRSALPTYNSAITSMLLPVTLPAALREVANPAAPTFLSASTTG